MRRLTTDRDTELCKYRICPRKEFAAGDFPSGGLAEFGQAGLSLAIFMREVFRRAIQ